MTSKQQAKEDIKHLINRYENMSAASRRALNEANTRKDYILPFFKALGWQIDDSAEVAEEVRVGKDWADYAFRLDGITRFFVEAKAIRVDLEEERWAKQAVSYAYNKGVPWAVLTDFQGLKLFNAEWDVSEVTHLRVLDLRYDQYLEYFDDLWALSRHCVEHDGLRQTFEKRGGAVRKRQPVGVRLFDLFKEWRLSLLNMLVQYQPPDTPLRLGAIDESVQRILDRLIFIRTLEDRHIEDPILWPIVTRRQPQLGKKASGDDAWQSLKTEFRRLDTVYDSNLFRRHLTDDLQGDESIVLPILKQLYWPDGTAIRFDFNAIEADVLGRVYEQYLGHVTETTKQEIKRGGKVYLPGMEPANAATVELVNRQAKRKQQGIYYTPKYIVDYIVEQTLGKWLDEHGHIPERREKLAVLDPACGSGSFLIAAFDKLLEFYAELHQLQGPEHLSQDERVEILTRHIYGVDLDPQAVEIARLNLVLRALKSPQLLPELDDNIVCGNSLISGNAETLEGYFGKDWRDKHPLNWEERFPHVFGARGLSQDKTVGLSPLSLWLVTFVTHNSRVSERMVTFGVQSGEPLIFSPEDMVLIAELIAEACTRHHIPVVTFNVLPDHVHMVIAAPTENDLNEQVRKIKGYSSHAFQRARGWHGQEGSGLKPTVSTGSGHQGSVWARKFNRKPITDDAMLTGVIHYVENNHLKHAERWGDWLELMWDGGADQDSGLKPTVSPRPLVEIVREVCLPAEEAITPPPPEVMERGGFDVVIGNPPYVRMEEFKELKQYLKDGYESYADRGDIYYYFVERAINLLRRDARLGLILSNTFTRSRAGKALRQLVVTNLNLTTLVEFGDFTPFLDATTYPIIVVGEKSPQRSTVNFILQDRDPDSDPLPDRFPVKFQIPFTMLKDSEWVFEEPDSIRLRERLLQEHKSLSSLFGPTRRGIVSGLNEAFIISDKERESIISSNPEAEKIIKPYIAGRGLDKWSYSWNNEWLIYTPHGIDMTSYPEILKHLNRFKSSLESRATAQEWYELQQPQEAYVELLERPKIIYPDISRYPKFNLDKQGEFYFSNTVYFIQSDSTYLLGLLNSQLLWYVVRGLSNALRGGLWRFRLFSGNIDRLPIRTIDSSNPTDVELHGRVVRHVEALLNLHQRLAALPEHSDEWESTQRQINQEDAALDAVVYQLYGLTDEEIAIIEGR